jgi:membrane protein implicated in regulation of membrane protease activity
MALLVLTHMLVIAATLVFGLSLAPLVTRWFWPLFAAANVFAVVWALALYLGGRARGHEGTGNRLREGRVDGRRAQPDLARRGPQGTSRTSPR